ncbi:PAS domain S-box protein, partial [bacterium]|nr:PAS domain S-box protein [bacterium]
MNSILIIDDEPAILDSLKVLLHGDYQVFTAKNATDAQKILANEAIQVVLSDHFLPDISGMEYLQEVQVKYPHIIRILITGYANFEMAVQAINQGHVYKFLTKPLNPAMLKVEISDACTMYHLMQKNRDLAGELQQYNFQLEQQVEERTAEIIRSRNRYQALVESMPVWVWETNDNFEVTYSSPHCLAVTGYPPEELLGRLIFDFLILPQRVGAITAEVRLTLTSPEAIANITEQIAEKSGHNVQYLQSSIRPILSKNSPSPSYIGVSRDVTQQKEHEEASHRHERELSLLVEASNYLTTIGEESTALDSMLRGASLAVGADSGLLFLFDQKAENFSIVSANGFAGTQLKSVMEKLSQLELGSPRGIVGLVGQTRAILTIEHVKNDPGWINIDPNIESAIWIPISHEGRLLGVLSLFSHEISGFNRTSIRLGKLFADKVAVVLENNRLYSEISRSAERYGSIIENALDVIYICDLNGQVLYTNPQATVLLGYTEQEFQQRRIWELIVPQYRESVRNTYRNMLKQDFQRQFIQFEIEDKQGKRHWFEQNVSVLQRDGISNIFQAINRDLSDRKHAERALKLSEQRYRHLVENAHEMVILVNSDGLLTFFNNSFMRSTGYSHHESEQLEFQKLIHADDWPQLKDTFHKLFAGQHFSPTHEFRLLTKAGATRHIDATFSTVTEDDAVTAVQSMMRDVTERKQSEAALQEYKERLSLV